MENPKIIKSNKKTTRRLTKETCKLCGKKIYESVHFLIHREYTMKEECECISKEKAIRNKRIAENERKRKIEAKFQQSELGKKFKEATFENTNITKHNQELVLESINYCDNFESDKSLLLHGHGGTGKTHITSAICNSLIQKNKAVIFKEVPLMIDLFFSTYDKNTNITKSSLLHGIMEADLLVLDDLGTESPAQHKEELILTIINTRYKNNKATIFTTNLNVEELKNRYHHRIFSRIMEMVETNIFDLNKEKDYRIQS